MSAVWMRFRAELRRRWRSLVALTLLAGIPAGIAIAAASGAARTDSVVDRLVAETRPPLLYMSTYFQETKLAFDDVAGLPVVSEAILFRSYGVMKPGPEELEVGAPVGIDIPRDRIHVLEGRIPRPGRADEATINYRAQQRYHWKVGDVVPMRFAGRGSSFFGGEVIPGPSLRVTIVGVTANAGDFVGIAGPSMEFGAAFSRMYDPLLESAELYTFSLTRGVDDIPAFNAGLFELTGGSGVLAIDGRSGIAQVRRVFRLHGAALWVLAIAIAVVSALIFAQATGRLALLRSGEDRTLGALGMTRRDLAKLSLARSATIAVGSTVLAAGIAAALSPIFPLGTPRFAETHPGFSLPAATFWVGVAVVAFLAFAFASVSSVVASRLGAADRDRRVTPSLVVRVMSALTRRPAPAVGARFALEPGRGATAIPVRTSLTATVTGIVALLAALTAGASLNHLLDTPSLYGWTWDLAVPGDFSEGSKDLQDLTADAAVASASVGTGGEGAAFTVDFRSRDAAMSGIVVDRVKGTLGPRLLSGRVPTAADEAAFGPKTLESLHARIGDVVRVGLLGKPPADAKNLRVVGEVVLPFDDDTTGVGEGVWMTHAAAHTLADEVPREAALIRFAHGTDRRAAIARLQERFPSEGEEFNQFTPRTIQSLERMSGLTIALAALLAGLAAGTLAHMLTTSIRRRRRDLAILRTMGFSTGQVRSAVGWQAALFVSVGLAIAIPLGIVAGRLSWQVIARYGGFAGAPAVPASRIAIVAASALVAALLLATLPARAAARTRPALVLRTE